MPLLRFLEGSAKAEGKALPKIVSEISKTKYLNHIIIGLDKAYKNQAKDAWKFLKNLKLILLFYGMMDQDFKKF